MDWDDNDPISVPRGVALSGLLSLALWVGIIGLFLIAYYYI